VGNAEVIERVLRIVRERYFAPAIRAVSGGDRCSTHELEHGRGGTS
jgi:acetolactate synthase regulatory subunit